MNDDDLLVVYDESHRSSENPGNFQIELYPFVDKKNALNFEFRDESSIHIS